MTKLLQMLLPLVLQCLLIGTLQAAPQLDLREQDRMRLHTDVRSLWQTALVPGAGADPKLPLDAQTVWSWSDSQFTLGKAEPVRVQDGNRLIGRFSVLLQDSPHSLLVDIPMPRLDIVHLSYRYNDEPWRSVTAGDQIPMVKWPFASRMPVFIIPPKPGELQIIVDIPAQDLFPSPVMLWADPAFREEQTIRNMEASAALSLALTSMLICFGAAVIFRRFVFVAVGLYSIGIFFVASGQGGILGVYIGTTTTWFNDYIKFTSAACFGALVPWTISAVVAQKHYSRWVARLADVWLVGSIAATFVMFFTVPRASQWAMLSPFLIVSLLFALGIAIASVLRRQVHAYLSVSAVLMLCVGIFAPIAAYWGYLDGTWSFSITAFAFISSSIMLLLALLLQYRHGNRVIARATDSPGRDALTGLLNRDVFERKLTRKIQEINTSGSYTLFVYISASDTATLQERFGGEGFESGMVQMAAALSSSISVMDTVARVATNAFAITVDMPHDAKPANALAQKLITRLMVISSHSAPMAQTARIALAWLPVYGTALPDIERLAKEVLLTMEDGKRIGWVGGVHAHADQAHTSEAASTHSLPVPRKRGEELNSIIDRIERTMEKNEKNQKSKTAINDERAERLMKVLDKPPK
jgi:GGDEF domain-containing protein